MKILMALKNKVVQFLEQILAQALNFIKKIALI